MAQFINLPPKGDPANGTGLFYNINQDAVSFLEKLTAADKAFCVPYVRIWQVDPKTGKPAYPAKENAMLPKRPISLQMIQPPQFGQPLDFSLLERPPVSLEKITVKSTAFQGRYDIQTINLSIKIHRPSAIGILPEDVDDWGSLLIPGNVHALEYGWSTSPIKNPLFNGEGINQNSIIVPARKVIYFTVTNYNFKIEADKQIKVDINAFESGMLNLRKFIIGAKATQIDATKLSGQNREFKNSLPDRNPQKNFYDSPEGKALLNDLSTKINNLSKSGPILFKDLLNKVFAETITQAFLESGYSGTITLAYGNFNKRVGKTSPKFNSTPLNSKPIGEFPFPLNEIKRIITENVKLGKFLTVQNFLSPFVALINKTTSWTSDNASKRKSDGAPNQALPDIFFKVVTNNNSIGLYIIDAKREFCEFTEEDNNKYFLGIDAKPDQVRQALKDKGIPLISFLNGNSFIKDAGFQTTADEKFKANQIIKYMGKDARQEQAKPDVLEKTTAVDPRTLLYSGAIQGDITVLGNFAFELFGLVWLEFGVNRWDGPFYIKAHSDEISRGVFETKLSFISSGQDPLGTQGKRKLTVPSPGAAQGT